MTAMWKPTRGYWGNRTLPLCSVTLPIDQKIKVSLLSAILKMWRPDNRYIFWNRNMFKVGSLYLGNSDVLYFLLWGAVLGQKDIRIVSWSLDPSSTVTVRNVRYLLWGNITLVDKKQWLEKVWPQHTYTHGKIKRTTSKHQRFSHWFLHS